MVEKESTVEAPVETKEASATDKTSTETWATGGCNELLGSLGRDRRALRNSLGGFHHHAHCGDRLCRHLCMAATRILREDASSYESETHRQAKNEGSDKFSQFQHRVSSTFCVQVPSSSRVNLQNALRKAHAPGVSTHPLKLMSNSHSFHIHRPCHQQRYSSFLGDFCSTHAHPNQPAHSSRGRNVSYQTIRLLHVARA
jgi:hypothetical protein